MTYDEFSAQLNRLRGLPFQPPDYRTHWEGLQDVALDALAFAVGRAARSCERFPSPYELRQLADTRPPSPPVALPSTELDEPFVLEAPKFFSKPITITRVLGYYCEHCDDTGRVTVWCNRHPGEGQRKPWVTVEPCLLLSCIESAFYPHEWVKRCACWSTNPVLIRRREAQGRYAEQRATK